MSQIYTIPCNRNEDVFIHAIPGHYVTASAHLNYYVGTSDIKHNRVVSVEAAKLLEFEHAAFLRDQIDRLRRGENPTVDSDAETERRQNHAQTQRRGRKYLGKR